MVILVLKIEMDSFDKMSYIISKFDRDLESMQNS